MLGRYARFTSPRREPSTGSDHCSREMTPGQVLYQSGYDDKADQDVYTTGSVREFQSFACS
ncbi:hypothetical protein BN11_4460003 [Nostocoides australiense Ben110]|uniref:Uncharacterized protein n=1 Tax=Nostocoides australiense Ben110 TaxID=1193182 RepID=W6K0D6_9MICO|nr:hypothetical protein BN11_4460003 [Tetrasphaera australiensis Ben110]